MSPEEELKIIADISFGIRTGTLSVEHPPENLSETAREIIFDLIGLRNQINKLKRTES
jgi:hypothetical protein